MDQIPSLCLEWTRRVLKTECVSPKFICWSPKPQCVGIWGWGCWEVIRVRLVHKGGDFIVELMPYEKRKKLEMSLSLSLSLCLTLSPHLPPREGAARRWQTVCKPGRELSYLMTKIYLFQAVGPWGSECLDLNPSRNTYSVLSWRNYLTSCSLFPHLWSRFK